MAVTAAAAACSAGQPGAGERSTSTADCAVEVRVDGTVYVESGFAPRPPGRLLGTAELASCADVGRDAPGSWFGDDPQQVRVWAVPGRDPGDVVAIRAPGGQLRILEAVEPDP